MFVLSEKINNKYVNVDKKFQFGDLKHAKRKAEKLAIDSANPIFWVNKTNNWFGYDSDNIINFRIQKVKGGTMKKKRSAKQLANDRRLGRMAKARAKAKRGGRRKVTRKKTKRNPHKKVARRKVSAKSRLWNVFKCHGSSVMFLGYSLSGKPAWTKDRGKAIIFKASDQAHRYASGIANMRGYAKYHLGAVSQKHSVADIRNSCKAGKV